MRKGSCCINDTLAPQAINQILVLSRGNEQRLRKILQVILSRQISESKLTKWLTASGLRPQMQLLREAHKASLMRAVEVREKIPKPTGDEWISIPTHSQLEYKFSIETFALWSPFRDAFIEPFVLGAKEKQYPAYSIAVAPGKKKNITLSRLYQQCLDGKETGTIKWQDGIGIIAKQPDPFEPSESYWSVNEYATERTQETASKLIDIKYGKKSRPEPNVLAEPILFEQA